HWLRRQTMPLSQSSFPAHQPCFLRHLPWVHTRPAGQSSFLAHSAHCLLKHFSPALQSLSPSHAGYFGDGHAASASKHEINSRGRALAMAATLVSTADRGNLRKLLAVLRQRRGEESWRWGGTTPPSPTTTPPT